MRRAWRPIAIWSAMVLAAAGGMLLYAAGGMDIGLGLLGIAGAGAVVRVAARVSRGW